MRAIEKARPDVQEAVDRILDIFGGGDNSAFLNFLNAINRWTDEEAEKPAATQLLNMIVQFSRLLEAVQPQKANHA